MQPEKSPEYILGLDVGVNSIGWALVGTREGKPASIIRTGVRVFSFNPDFERDYASGKPASLAGKRREARTARRMLERRARRQRKLFNILQRAELLPAGEPGQAIPALDRKLLAETSDEERSIVAHVLPYTLRARALDGKLETFELGRALYHLGQRRGFESNRKSVAKDEEEEGEVKKGISELEGQTKEAGARTLGEYFAGLDPREKRIRTRYTSRRMYKDEFEMIWSEQARHRGAVLTDELKKKVYEAMFFQRPLRSAKGLVGLCELEPGRRRAAWAQLAAQRFRAVQMVNNTEVWQENGEVRRFTDDERRTLLQALEEKGDMSFADAKRLLGLSRRSKFNLEAGGEKRFVGNRTNAKMAKIFGEKWEESADREREGIVADVLGIQEKETLARRAQEEWGLTKEQADELANVRLEGKYCRLSRRAIRKLMPHLEEGLTYAEAIQRAYGERSQGAGAVEVLPPFFKYERNLRNPVVTRVLSELRKVINAVVKKYGKPAVVRIELARDMKKTAKDRDRITRQNRENEKARQNARRKLEEAGVQDPSRDDILKVLLAEECNWECPYTGKQISVQSLGGQHSQFDTEHIIPFSMCLDDSFMNKTLCDTEENRNVKKKRTPYEAYGGNPERHEEILSRVKKFKGSGRNAKLDRFRMKEVESIEEFAARQLNDTRYASRQAAGYVGLLYGGVVDESGKRRVQASRGGVTKYLRDEWGLNAILADGGEKSREDHRHHAVDALCVAVADAGVVKRLSDAAARAQAERRRRFGRLDEPFEGFYEAARQSIGATNVSHRFSGKINGPLHDETYYGKAVEKDEKDKEVTVTVVRKPLEGLTKGEVEEIIDPVVKGLVKGRLEEAEGDLKKAFGDKARHPFLTSRDGKTIPIHKVRIRKAARTVVVGQGARARNVVPGSNHHVEIFETTDEKGRIRWEGRIVTRLEAVRCHAAGKPVVDKGHEGGGRYVFSLAPGEMIELDGDGVRQLYVVRVTSINASGYINISYVRHTDARKKEKIMGREKRMPGEDRRKNRRKAGESDWKTSPPESLRKLNCRKVIVTPLGEIRRAND